MANAPQRGQQRTLQRLPQRTIRRASNRFDVDQRRIPDGSSYQWIAETVLGRPDEEGMATALANGFTAVPASRHPEMFGMHGSGATDVIRRGGQILMERPTEIHEQSKAMDRLEAAEQMGNQMERLRMDGHRKAGRGITRNYIPADADLLDE